MEGGNKITKNLNVAEGANRSPGRKYPLTTESHQESGGYKALTNRHHIAPNDKALENSYQTKVGQWAKSVPMPKGAKLDVMKGSQNRGHLSGTNAKHGYDPKVRW